MDSIVQKVPTFRGIKFSHTDYMDLNQCLLKNNSTYNILFGCDQVCVKAFRVPYIGLRIEWYVTINEFNVIFTGMCIDLTCTTISAIIVCYGVGSGRGHREHL